MTSAKKFIDAELIKRLQNSEEEALAIIYKEYWQAMYLSAYNLVKDKSICEDIVQEVFISLWQRRKKLKIKVSLKGYLYTSTVYKTYDYINKNKKIIKEELFDNFNKKIHATTPETKLMHEELVLYIDSIIETLPPKCKEVYKLSRDMQLTNDEIAAQLNISKRTVEGHISKALKILKDSLGVVVSLEFIAFLGG